jgi:hypothetical protein
VGVTLDCRHHSVIKSVDMNHKGGLLNIAKSVLYVDNKDYDDDGMMKEDEGKKHHGKWHKDKNIKEEITMIAMINYFR